MTSETQLGVSLKYRLAIAVLSLLGTGMILLSTSKNGAGLGPDSVDYIATARNLSSGGGLASFEGTPLLLWPPLYSALLGGIDRVLTIDPLSSAPVVNAVLFGAIIYLSGLLFGRHLMPALALLGTVFVVVAIPLVFVSLVAWSEPLFIFVVLLYLILSERYLAQGDTISLLLLASSVALACLTRYIGVVLILTGAVSILLFRRGTRRVTSSHLLVFIAVSASPIGIWLVRNYLLSGTLFGPRASSMYTLSQNAGSAFNTVLSWYLPGGIREQGFILVLMSATAGLLAVLGAKVLWQEVRAALLEMGPQIVFVVSYVGFLIVSSSTTAYDTINSRLMSPVYVSMTLLVQFIGSKILASLARRPSLRKRVTILLGVAFAALLAYPLTVAVSSTTHAMNQGLGYGAIQWRNSQTIEFLRENHTPECDSMMYSNGPDAIYILANLAAETSPRKPAYNSADMVTDTSSLRGAWPEEGLACLVWFDGIARNYLFTLDELHTIANLQLIERLEDGAVYSVARE